MTGTGASAIIETLLTIVPCDSTSCGKKAFVTASVP
jgi:hypothetical protein